MIQLPSDSRSQEIGRLAQRALSAKLPRAWIDTPMAGDSDYGIDYHIQLKNEQQQVEYSFYLQLKGTTTPSFNADESLSFQFDCSTLNNYYTQEPLVMVAVVNLRDNMDETHNCPIYYLWLDYEWFKLHERKLKDQETITIRIPTNQLITTKLDVYDFYKKRITERMALSDLSREISPHTEDIIGTLSSIRETINDKPFVLKALEHNGDEPWVENPEGHFPTELKKIQTLIQNNKLISAGRLVDALESKTNLMNQHETAELWYQKAILMELYDDLKNALEYHMKASLLSDKNRYLVSYLDARLKTDPSIECKNIQEQLEPYPNSDKRILFIKVKCMALNGFYEEALALISKHHPDYISAKLMVYTLIDDKAELDNILNTIDVESLTSIKEKIFIHFLIGRRAYLKANNDTIQYDQVVSIYGLPNADLSLLELSYVNYRKAWDLTEELGYPQDFSLLLDISPLVFSYYNNMPELFRHFENLLRERPKHSEVLHIYTRLLFNQGDYVRVIILLETRVDEIDFNDKILLFLSYYNNQKPVEALELFKSIEDMVLNTELSNKASLFCIASKISSVLFEVETAEKYMSIVKSLPEADEVLALSEFLDACDSDPTNVGLSLCILYEKYIKLGKPLYLAEQLINNLQVNSIEDAEKYIDVASTILQHHGLSEQDSFQYANSLITLKEYDEALTLINNSIKKEFIDPNWYSLKALALQNRGEPGLAIDCITEVLQSSHLSNEILKIYIHLCIQFGLIDEIEKTIIEVISKSSDTATKVQLLIQLHNIYVKSDKYKDKRMPVLRQIAKFVDQNDCEQEGLFLTLFLTSEKNDDLQELSQWQKRLQDYLLRFPDSGVLQRAEIDPEAKPEDLIHALNTITGVTPEKIEWWENNREQIRNGSLAVPFAMRGFFLRDTRDLFTTWSLAKTLPEEHLEFKIRHSTFLPQNEFNNIVAESNNLILDETSLLVLSELDILNDFLPALTKFSLLSTTFNNISKHAQSIIHTDTTGLAQRIIACINEHRSKLKIFDCNDKNMIESYARSIVEKDYILLTDDIYLQSLVLSASTKKVTINSINVILFLLHTGVLTESHAYSSIAKLANKGIFQPNMSIQTLSEVYYYYLTNSEDGETLESSFNTFFDSIVSPLRKSSEAASVVIRMLITASLFDNPLPSPKILLGLFRTLLNHHPYTSLDNILTIWFIQQCGFILQINPDGDIDRFNKLHQMTWLLYKEVMCEINSEYMIMDKLLSTIIGTIKNIDKDKRYHTYSSVKSCFVPLTQPALLLESKYQSMQFNDHYLQ